MLTRKKYLSFWWIFFEIRKTLVNFSKFQGFSRWSFCSPSFLSSPSTPLQRCWSLSMDPGRKHLFSYLSQLLSHGFVMAVFLIKEHKKPFLLAFKREENRTILFYCFFLLVNLLHSEAKIRKEQKVFYKLSQLIKLLHGKNLAESRKKAIKGQDRVGFGSIPPV